MFRYCLFVNLSKASPGHYQTLGLGQWLFAQNYSNKNRTYLLFPKNPNPSRKFVGLMVPIPSPSRRIVGLILFLRDWSWNPNGQITNLDNMLPVWTHQQILWKPWFWRVHPSWTRWNKKAPVELIRRGAQQLYLIDEGWWCIICLIILGKSQRNFLGGIDNIGPTTYLSHQPMPPTRASCKANSPERSNGTGRFTSCKKRRKLRDALGASTLPSNS